jgi:hypothetical protein
MANGSDSTRMIDVESGVFVGREKELERLELGVITETDGSPIEYRFRYAVVRDAILDRMPAKHRLEIHSRAAAVFEDRYLAGNSGSLPNAIRHLEKYILVHGTAKLVRYRKEHAKEALQRFAPTEAVTILEATPSTIKATGRTDAGTQRGCVATPSVGRSLR